MDRVILHVDMNSYFATVEQQANPLLRGKPIAVSGRPHINSVIAAASIEAKKFGVKSGMNTWEAKKLCPCLIFIPGDPAKYLCLSEKMIRILRSYTPFVEIFSIDEAFLEMPKPLQGKQIRHDSIKMALEIKQRIREEIGEHVTCSIGIAKNKFLAKLASEKKKPNGLTMVTEENFDEILLSSKLDDFCGIGRQILKKLQGMGIYTVAQLRQVPEVFVGRKLHNMAYGIDNSPVIFNQLEAKSFSHSLTLPKETTDKNYVEAVLLYLCEKVARRMRAENFCGRTVWCNGYQKSSTYYTNEGQEIFKTARTMLYFPIRAVYVGMANLKSKDLTNKGFFNRPEIEMAMDLVNDKFGENTVFRAATLPVFVCDRDVAGLRTRFRFQ